MKRLLYAFLALSLLTGCGKSRDVGPRPIVNDGGAIVTPETSTKTGSHISHPHLSDQDFTVRIKQFLATDSGQNYNEIIIGTVLARTENPRQGMQIFLNMGINSNEFSDWQNIDPKKMSLEILIHDSFVQELGYEPIRFGFGQAFGANPEKQSIKFIEDGRIEMQLNDEYGKVWLEGDIENNIFSGSFYFRNFYNDYSENIGDFRFPKCALFLEGC